VCRALLCAGYVAGGLFACLLLAVAGVSADAAPCALRDVADVYETVGRFLSDLNLLSEVRF